MISEKNVANLLIVKNVNTTQTAGANISAAISGMNVGESTIVSPGGVIVDAAGTLPKEFKIDNAVDREEFRILVFRRQGQNFVQCPAGTFRPVLHDGVVDAAKGAMVFLAPPAASGTFI